MSDEQDYSDVPHEEKLRMISAWTERHGINVNIERYDKPGSDRIDYSVTISRSGKSCRVDYHTGVGWVEKSSNGKWNGTRAEQNVTYDPVKKTIIKTRRSCGYIFTENANLGNDKYRILQPSVGDILHCLRLDAQTLEDSNDFESWADELGFNPDSRKDERIYLACVTQTRELRGVIGHEAWS